VKLTAHQPVYLPWLGLFHKINLCDCFCYFDIVQYQHKDYNNRNLIKTNSGAKWLSVPVESKNHFEKKIKDIKIINNGWNKKHFKSIYFAYKHSKYFNKYIEFFEEIYLSKRFELLSDLNLEILKFALKEFDIKTKIIKASEQNFDGQKSALVLDMCEKLGAKQYIFGSQGSNYADLQSFKSKGIEVYFQKYIHPTYIQINGKFLNNMSFIDLIFNEGPNSKKIFMKNNVSEI